MTPKQGRDMTEASKTGSTVNVGRITKTKSDHMKLSGQNIFVYFSPFTFSKSLRCKQLLEITPKIISHGNLTK